MNERRYDFELLQEFVRRGNQEAFGDLIRRHIDLVYGTALHKVEEAEAAKEVSQDVFAALARKAWQFGPDDSLPAWLHRTALLEAKERLRGELRRRRREQTAAELGTTMNTPDQEPALHALVPILDDALLALREKERTAVLLRFYESRSLREVGRTLGVSEDVAQKRVSGALEKMSRFFQRRGFKTATVAATAAALEHAAAPVSAATATAVAASVLQSAPPAISGIMGVVARLASLSRAQITALCLAVTAVPSVWQWRQYRVAGQEAARAQAELETARGEERALTTAIQRLTQTEQQLGAALARSEEVARQAAEAERKFESWKARIRGSLTAEDYHWPEDSPFVRVPKTAVPKLSVYMPMGPPGIIKPEARELMGLSPRERNALEDRLHAYFAEVDSLVESGVYETNQSSRVRPPDSAVASRIYYVPALGEAARASADQLAEGMKSVLGQPRWALVESQWEAQGTHTLRRILGVDTDQQSQEVSVYITPGEPGELKVGYHWASALGAFSVDGLPLASALPGGSAPGGNSVISSVEGSSLPGAVTSRLLAWLQEQAEARVSKESKP